MMQIENEYGSYSEDKTYLRQIKALMEKYGADVTLFTADGAWQATLRAGSLLEDKILATGNFGSHAQRKFHSVKSIPRKARSQATLDLHGILGWLVQSLGRTCR